jgi:excisionase family DNA binding protein
MTIPKHEFLTMGEVAMALRVDERTVRRWVAGHILPAIKIGNQTVRIRRRDLLELLSKSRTRKKRGAALRGTSIDPPKD